MERATVVDYEAFGNLVKDWAKGEKPIPKTLDELKDQAAQVGAGLVIPQQYKNLEIRQRTPDTLYLMVPVAQLVIDTEAVLQDKNSSYPLPFFYEDLFQMETPQLTPEEKLKLHAQRIGDYTTGQCG